MCECELSNVGKCFCSMSLLSWPVIFILLCICMCVCVTLCVCFFISLAYWTSAPRVLSSHTGLIDLWRRFSPQ